MSEDHGIDDQEIAMQGGNLSTVVRVGDTVRRSVGPWTPSVHALLHHLENNGFAGAPRALGIDVEGREMLPYLTGQVFSYPTPEYVWSEETLIAAGQSKEVRSFLQLGCPRSFILALGADDRSSLGKPEYHAVASLESQGFTHW